MTPSEFYRKIRPEFFSDSDIQTDYELPKEVLALELEKITTNQKESAFETFARRLAEKRISPNLIPQVGPTGGGDGKTDFETHKISEDISDRWFIPENGWDNNEKWAFAISAKKEWKSKLKKDIKSILSTNRGYTQIFFITNQKISSKIKKELEKAHKTEFGISVTILDGEWIIENVYNNNLIDLAVGSLNLSSTYKKQNKKVGKNDSERIDKLNELEANINNPKRYSENDYQLVEDALEAAILSRMLEKPKDEVVGRFNRAFRFANKNNNHQQKIRLHYQRAWTYFQFYDDFSGFIKDFNEVKLLLQTECTISGLELYFNLFNLLRTISFTGAFDLSSVSKNIESEEKDIKTLLLRFAEDNTKPTSSLISKTQIALLDLTNGLYRGENPDQLLVALKGYIESSRGHIQFPFEQFQEVIEKFGPILPNNENYDSLIEAIAVAAEVRNSELSSGAIYLRRGGQKYIAKSYKDSIIYLGKALMKLAKEESQYGFGLAMRALGEAYASLDLLWAANNCYIASCSLTFKSFFEKGIVDPRTYNSVIKLLGNELFVGRIPSFLIWHELFQILDRIPGASIEKDDSDKDSIEDDLLFDSCLSIRILHSPIDSSFQFLPAIFEKNDLTLSESASLYKLGYVAKLINEEYGIPAKSEMELDTYYKKWANQPFVNQMRYETNLLRDEEIIFNSNILGCMFKIIFHRDKEMYWAAETLLAFFEGILGTSLSGVIPGTESIIIHLIRNEEEPIISFKPLNDSLTEFNVELNSFEFTGENGKKVWDVLIRFFAEIVGKNFFFKDAKTHLKKLFKDEEVNERLGLLLEHRRFSISVLGNSPKFFLSDWIKGGKEFPPKRIKDLKFEKTSEIRNKSEKEFFEEEISHTQRKITSVINNYLWDQAKWEAFGSFYQENNFFGLFIGFANGEAGRKIFEEWITRFGGEDKEDRIRICIVKGIDKKNPYSYRVLITAKLDKEEFANGSFVYTTIRIHEMVPNSSKTLDDLIMMYNQLKYFVLIPAEFDKVNLRVKPSFDLGIKKKELSIRNAWEIGEHDPDMPGIKKGDNPIIPTGEINPPIKKLLERLKKGKD